VLWTAAPKGDLGVWKIGCLETHAGDDVLVFMGRTLVLSPSLGFRSKGSIKEILNIYCE
jgi:hypothetical protein